jgi:pyridoxamine 5'-phosphate oxidase
LHQPATGLHVQCFSFTGMAVLPDVRVGTHVEGSDHKGLSRPSFASQNSVMPYTLWRSSLILSLYQNRHAPHSRFVQMATVRADGRPANRTLTFRGFLHDTPRLTFVSDTRCHTADELAKSPWAEICWYFPVTREQFRIGGPVNLVGDDAGDNELASARRETWCALSEATRHTFAWPEPGRPREVRVPFPTQHPDPRTPLPHFCLIVLDPKEVDHLELNGNPQNRWEYHRDGDGRWSGVEVNP